MANSGSVGGRRGGKVEDTMSLSQAKAASTKKGSGKPTLGTTAKNDQSKVTNGKKSNK